MLFGGGRFDDYIGDIALFELLSSILRPSQKPEKDEEKPDGEDEKEDGAKTEEKVEEKTQEEAGNPEKVEKPAKTEESKPAASSGSSSSTANAGPNPVPVVDHENGEEEEGEEADAEAYKPDPEFLRKKKQQKKELTHKLISKLAAFGKKPKKWFFQKKDPVDEWTASTTAEARSLAEAPGGDQLLNVLAYVYIQEAQQHLGGLMSVWSEIREICHLIKNGASLIGSVMALQAAGQKLQGNENDEETLNLLMQMGLVTMWKVGILDVEMLLRGVCEKSLDGLEDVESEDEDSLLTDPANPPKLSTPTKPKQESQIPVAERKRRAEALKAMGKIFKKIAKEAIVEAAKRDKTSIKDDKKPAGGEKREAEDPDMPDLASANNQD
eukprot:TRINITY_DN1193_c0_g1_i2.p1 TRINITY_DN1193_c0_g1~~TRINITY_DN1193_c0_g1_i2.p1  ORF type:complete len:382 (+),score=193.34 TRINITY_DN1193_c0_g1_i2:482-1627(+)